MVSDPSQTPPAGPAPGPSPEVSVVVPVFNESGAAPDLAREIAAAFAEKGAHMLDAPVSGGPRGARTGKLAIWVGGDKDVFEKFKAKRAAAKAERAAKAEAARAAKLAAERESMRLFVFVGYAPSPDCGLRIFDCNPI